MKQPLHFLLTAFLILMIVGCAQLSKKAESIKPTANLSGMHLANINFEQVDLVFDLDIENKNPVALKLAGLDYDFKIENQSLVSGTTAQGLQINAESTSRVQLPVTLRFNDLRKLPGEIAHKDNVAYLLDTKFVVALPVIGDVTVPVSKQGELPVPKLPKFSIKDVKIKNLGFTSADVVAQVEVDNPNAFELAFSKLDYQLDINQQNWGQGMISQRNSVPQKGKGTIEIPLKLNLLSMGQAAYTMLSRKQPFEYNLKGNVTLDTGLELLRNYNMPLDIKGNASLK